MIITALSQDYLAYLLGLLMSLQYNSPQDKMSVYLINIENRIENLLRRGFPKVYFEGRTVDVKGDQSGMLSNYRSILLKEYMEHGKEPIAWMDTDMMVRRSLRHFWQDVTPTSLKLKTFPGKKLQHRFQSGMFAVGCSKETRHFISDWNDAVQVNPIWYSDQIQLHNVYNKHRWSINLVPMSHVYNDKLLRPSGIIWHYKNSRKPGGKRYSLELALIYTQYLEHAEKAMGCEIEDIGIERLSSTWG